MTSAATTPGPLTALDGYSLRRFTVQEYQRMIADDILNEQDRVELLEGWIVLKMSHNPPHDIAIELTEDALRARLPTGWRIRIQSAVVTTDSQPEPDLAVVRGDPCSRAKSHPDPRIVALIIEVAESSLNRDCIDKARLYARAAVVCYWIVNLVDRQVEVYTDPTGPDAAPTYRKRQDFGENDSVPLVIDGQEVARIPVRDLLP